MIKSSISTIWIFCLLVILTSCSKNFSLQLDGGGNITGVWVRSLSDRSGVEGIVLLPSGELRLINIFSMTGDSWTLQDDQLTLFTHTERYPQSVADVYTVQSLSDKKMVLTRQFLEIAYRRPAPGASLMVTRWLASYVPGALGGTEPEKEIFFNLKHDGRIEGFAGCNTFRGSYTISGKTIKIGPLLSTKMLCPAMAAEDNLFRALAETEEFFIVEDQLYFYRENVLQGFFRAQQE